MVQHTIQRDDGQSERTIQTVELWYVHVVLYFGKVGINTYIGEFSYNNQLPYKFSITHLLGDVGTVAHWPRDHPQRQTGIYLPWKGSNTFRQNGKAEPSTILGPFMDHCQMETVDLSSELPEDVE
ncbi:hypothetical protein Tco_1394490 [Tanacetum coccineum]